MNWTRAKKYDTFMCKYNKCLFDCTCAFYELIVQM